MRGDGVVRRRSSTADFSELITRMVLAALNRAKDVERIAIGGTVLWRLSA